MDGAVERIEEYLLNLGLREVLSRRIGELVMFRAEKARQSRLCAICQRVPQSANFTQYR